MGIFKKLLDLRIRAHNKPLEDYLTEIISYIFEHNAEILNNFLIHFKIIETPADWYKITTQHTLKKLDNHASDSRPDMAIFLETGIVFFEHKINASEGLDQLKRYAEHLDQLSDGRKTLVYLTKHYDFKETNKIFSDCKNVIDFIPIRWYQVYRFFENYKADPLSFELLLFMKQINLSMHNQFKPSDIITMTNFTNVLKMMDETMFGEVQQSFSRINNGMSRDFTCITELGKYDRYMYYKEHSHKLWCGLGYWMNSDNEKDYPELNIVIEIGPKSIKRKEVVDIFKSILKEYKDWTGYDLSDPSQHSGIAFSSSLQTFLSKENQIEEIKQFFRKGLEQLEAIFTSYKTLPLNNN
ncbi:MAG: PD-(D/E)XK nuclease family protein [Leeuwenhoekiella sp.]|uniref:PD-(D/E)XK nuclease family protein n=1 Tax=Leeuwenhoekiella sp. TaxID=1977054 RepID=UPI0032428754